MSPSAALESSPRSLVRHLLLTGLVAFIALCPAPVAVAQADTSPPVLVSSSVTPTSVNVSSSGQQVTVTVRVTDATGAQTPTINLSSTTTSQTAGFGSMTLVSGSATDGTYSKTVTIPQGAATG